MAPRKILMLTNAELGQANVFIATTHSLLEQDSDIQIHVASFPSLQKTLTKALGSHESSRVTFHPLPGRTMFDCFAAEEDPKNNLMTVTSLRPGFKNTPLAMHFIFTKGLICWAPEEFAEIFHAICALVKDVKPDLVLVDMLLTPGVTAAQHLREGAPDAFKFAILSPNSLKDYIHHLEQKNGAVFWKWPITGSGLPMPIPWYSIWLNIYLAIYMIWTFMTDKSVSAFQDKVREASHLPNLKVWENISMVNGGLPGVDKVFIGGRPEVEFAELDYDSPPEEYMSKIEGCGPILRPIVPIDSELEAWLKRGPTILISLGSHCLTTEEEALAMARSLKHVIDEASRRQNTHPGNKLQVLWKLQKDLNRGTEFGTGPGSAFHKVLGKEMDEDRVRIVTWLTSEPNSILNTGSVICNICHGGANSFYEAVCSGVAQVVLPPWLDCYDFANRAELLGIGRWGSRQGAPRWIESELAPILVDAVLDKNAEYTAKARHLAEICRKDGGGRAEAARRMLAFLKE